MACWTISSSLGVCRRVSEPALARTSRNSSSVGSAMGVTYRPSPISVTRREVPGRIFFRSQNFFGKTTWRFVVTLIVVVIVVSLSYDRKNVKQLLARSPFGRLQERQQIGQLLMAQLLIQSRRHYGDGSGPHLGDIRPRDANF